MKSRLLDLVRAFTLGVLFVSGSGQAATVLVSHPVANAEGYGWATWTNMTNTLDSATNDSVTVVSFLDDFGQMLNYDAIWVDTRGPSGSLSTAETANIANYISTGRRVVMMGENDSWINWNNQILGIVGGSYIGDSNNPLLPITSNQLTDGVGSVVAPAHGVALGGMRCFQKISPPCGMKMY